MGELQSPTPRLYSEYFVQLVDLSHRLPAAKVDVRSDGVFEFRGLLPGEYAATVTTLAGDLVCEQLLSLSPQSSRFILRVPESRVSLPGARTVSAKQLLHPPTKKAFRSFVAAQKFSSAGDYTHAAEALQQALAESPDYAEAHINLGVQYIRTGRMAAAEAELQRGLEIGGPNPLPLFNLAAVQAKLGRREQAIETARTGLRLDAGSAQGNLVLGMLLASDPKVRAEALAHLEKAADTIPSARGMIERLKSVD